MRLIDADALYKDVCNSMTTTAVVGGEWLWRKLWDAIKYAPTIEPQQWIPCRERLPEESGLYIVTNVGRCGELVETRYYYIREDGNFWGGHQSRKVLAWMPLPASYRKEGEE